MDISQLNGFDYFIAVILALSVLLGVKRGLLCEIIALISWLAAFAIAIIFTDALVVHMNNYVKTEFLSVMASFTLLFAGTLIIGAIVNYLASSLTSSMGGLSFMNHLLGSIFGLIRGGIISLFIVFILVNTPTAEASWFKEAQSVIFLKEPIHLIQARVLPSPKDKEKQQVFTEQEEMQTEEATPSSESEIGNIEEKETITDALVEEAKSENTENTDSTE